MSALVAYRMGDARIFGVDRGSTDYHIEVEAEVLSDGVLLVHDIRQFSAPVSPQATVDDRRR
ncbi:hypothetical protein [Roseovarius sp. MMSF_3281]|uniref:hypothetical protein n=1 Tax=Roseovarius sp. MMSF_3281 TaxID=3046694 RepID=UPI00273F20A7|nr:hypothetical protein [Roseovarius sp. MMSF_3281]